MRSSSISKTLLTLPVFIFLTHCNLLAQGFRLDDPNLIFKNKDGKVLSVDSVKALIGKGMFSMEQTNLENGKTEIVITVMTSDDVKTHNDKSDEWASKWTNIKLPEFNLKNLKGENVSNSDLTDRFAVINFWFIGCKPCVAEIPELNKLVKKYKDQPILFLAPSRDSSDALSHFVEKKTFGYTILPESTEFMKEMGIYAYPTHLIIDRKGIIREVIVGGPDIYTRLDSLIQKIIQNQ